MQAGWSTANAPRIVLGTALYLSWSRWSPPVSGPIIRNLVGAVVAFVGVLLVLQGIVAGLSQTWQLRLSKWIPANAGQSIMQTQVDHNFFSPWRGMAVFIGYAAAAILVAALLLKRRDA